MTSGGVRKRKERPVVTLVIVAITLSLLAISVSSFFYHLNGDSYDFNDSEVLFVPSNSMDAGPTGYEISTIPKNSLVMIKVLSIEDKGELKSGDVITFHQDGIYKVHRIVLISGEEVITKGDANPGTDPSITLEDVEGKVIGVSSVVGGVISVIRPLVMEIGWLLIVVLLLVAIMIYSIREVYIILRNEE